MNRPAAGSTSSLAANSQHRVINPKARLHGRPSPPARPGEIREPSVGADMMPPTARQAAAARISAAAALATVNRQAPLRGLVAGRSTARLMMYTDIYGPVGRNGKMSPSVPATLSWIISFPGSVPFISGPIDLDRRKLPHFTCQYVAVISAINGRQLDAYQTCMPTSKPASAPPSEPPPAPVTEP